MEDSRIRSGAEIAQKIDRRNENAHEVMRTYESSGRIGRLLMLRDPAIKRQIQYIRASESIAESRRIAEQGAGDILLGSAV